MHVLLFGFHAPNRVHQFLNHQVSGKGPTPRTMRGDVSQLTVMSPRIMFYSPHIANDYVRFLREVFLNDPGHFSQAGEIVTSSWAIVSRKRRTFSSHLAMFARRAAMS